MSTTRPPDATTAASASAGGESLHGSQSLGAHKASAPLSTRWRCDDFSESLPLPSVRDWAHHRLPRDPSALSFCLLLRSGCVFGSSRNAMQACENFLRFSELWVSLHEAPFTFSLGRLGDRACLSASVSCRLHETTLEALCGSTERLSC